MRACFEHRFGTNLAPKPLAILVPRTAADGDPHLEVLVETTHMAFSLIDFLILLIVAGICGGIAQAITGFSRGGCLVSIALGFIGALLGVGLARLTNLPELFSLQIGDVSFPIIWSIIGASIFTAVVALFTRRTPPPYYY
jgi:uncharacterized membrane protein YeaQ/YmgE (transglycosylase-associated protein family)